MKREHLQTLRHIFNEKCENIFDPVALEHVRALDVLIKADIQKEINDAGEALNAKYALPILRKG